MFSKFLQKIEETFFYVVVPLLFLGIFFPGLRFFTFSERLKPIFDDFRRFTFSLHFFTCSMFFCVFEETLRKRCGRFLGPLRLLGRSTKFQNHLGHRRKQ